MHTGIWWGNLRERDCLEELNLESRIILKFIFKKQDCILGWIVLIQDWDRWRARANAVMKLRVS